MWTRGLLLLLMLFGVRLSGHAQDVETERSFYMGFTPFPYAISFDAVDYTYDQLAQNADLMVHHFDNGVPWTEALDGNPYSQNVQDDWRLRLSRTPPDQKILVTVTPINLDRTGLALYRGTQDDMPLPAPFDTYAFDHPDVETAFLRYCEDIIAYFDPDFFLFGIEVNLLIKNNPEAWSSYKTLHRNVYTQLKASFPDLPVMVSMTGIDLIEGYTDADHEAQQQAFEDVIDYTDYLGLSVYPYMTAYMTNSLPTSLFDELATLTDKPIAITETGYPAQNFAIDAGNGFRLEFESDERKQADYITLLLGASQKHEFQFVVNFVLRDYDALWKAIGGREDLTIAWRDTGLFDEAGQERAALQVWREWLERPVTLLDE